MEIVLRKAISKDLVKIYQLYSTAYAGTYPDPTFSDIQLLEAALYSKTKFICVAVSGGDDIVGSLLVLYNKENKLAKASGAVVSSEFRGHNLTQQLMQYAIQDIKTLKSGLSIIYVTTRTVHKAAQILFHKIGFKELGIFPNVHKTNEYETHALAAIHLNGAIDERFVDFRQHPKVLPLYNIVKENLKLPIMKEAQLSGQKDYYGDVSDLEIIEAKKFIGLRAKELHENNEIDLAFFPFHTPNILITSPCQQIEVFAYVNEVDKHCVVTGCKINREVSFTDLFLQVSQILRNRGIRYIEITLRANRLNIIDKLINAKYLPCAYAPALQLKNGLRYDYVVLSRSFEILDFNNLELTGATETYLKNYIKLWEETFLGDYFKS